MNKKPMTVLDWFDEKFLEIVSNQSRLIPRQSPGSSAVRYHNDDIIKLIRDKQSGGCQINRSFVFAQEVLDSDIGIKVIVFFTINGYVRICLDCEMNGEAFLELTYNKGTVDSPVQVGEFDDFTRFFEELGTACNAIKMIGTGEHFSTFNM